MSPLQEGVVKAIAVAATLAAGGTVFTNAITNATQNQRIERTEQDIETLQQIQQSVQEIKTTVAVIEERTRHDQHK